MKRDFRGEINELGNEIHNDIDHGECFCEPDMLRAFLKNLDRLKQLATSYYNEDADEELKVVDVKFFEIESPSKVQIIVARSKYEALGFAVSQEDIGSDFTGDIWVRNEHQPNHLIEVSCVGYPITKTLLKMYEELENKELPQTVCNLAY